MRRRMSTRQLPSASHAGRPSSGGAAASSGRSSPSCSSRTSPTSSSTMSSRVTTPAVPPYSSTTTAMHCSLRIWAGSGRTGRVSGTSSAGRERRDRERVGHQQLRGVDAGDGGAQTVLDGDRQVVLEVGHADDLVDLLAVDREAGQAGRAGGGVARLGGGRG